MATFDTLSASRGPALARAAEALLRTLGGETVTLLLPLATTPDSDGLGLGTLVADELTFAPVVVRSLPPTGNRARRELLFAAGPVAAQVEARGAASAEALFDSALGVRHQGRLLHIVSVTPELFAGSAYLYRVVVVD